MFENLRDRFTDGAETRTDGGHSALSFLTGPETETSGSATDEPAVSEPAAADSGDETRDGDYTIGFDEIFGTLQNRRRRDVLRYLTTAPGQVRIGELAEEIAARECDKPVAQVTSTERKRVYVALYQCHLPKMADVRAISYDQPRGTIECGPDFELFEQYLSAGEGPVAAEGSGRDWIRSLSGFVTR